MSKYFEEALPDWKLHIRSEDGADVVLDVRQPDLIQVKGEKHESIPVYAEQKWRAGMRFDALLAMECSVSYSLIPDSVVLKKADGTVLVNGVDYMVDPVWGAFGCLPDSDIGETDAVYADYAYSPTRIDAVIRCGNEFFIRPGTPNGPTPIPAEVRPGEELVCSLFFDRRRKKFNNEMVFPFVEPFTPPERNGDIERQLKKTLAKLRNGEKVRILAWGDSVTACLFILEEAQRWPNRFAAELRRRFPHAEIELINLGWGGKAINTFQCEPPGSPWNYQEKVVQSGADLVLVEFVNDAYLTMEAEFKRIYNRVRDDFHAKGMECIFIIPHLVRPDWMGLTSQKNIEEDPRPYVKFLKAFIRENDFACADVSARFMHLWKEGFPYNALMLNHINHPDQRGIGFYCETLCNLFPEK